MSFTIITVEGTFQGPSGSPASGNVSATLSTPIQNGTTTVEPVTITKSIENGKLTLNLIANNDPSTLPLGSFYTFKLSIQGVGVREFKAVLEYNTAEKAVNITKLYESSGFIGLKTRPQLASTSTTQEIVEVLVALGLVEQVEKPDVQRF